MATRSPSISSLPSPARDVPRDPGRPTPAEWTVIARILIRHGYPPPQPSLSPPPAQRPRDYRW